MSRSNYSEDCDSNYIYLYRATVERALAGKRGQAFLKEMAAAMDAMVVKRLIPSELISESGEVCAIGSVLKARNVDVTGIDVEDPNAVGKAAGISMSMAAEIEYENDERSLPSPWICHPDYRPETPEERWVRMRKWVDEQLIKERP